MFVVDDLIVAAVVMGAIGAASQAYTNSKQRDEAKRQMEFQERMSNSAYQRSMQDMALAGLNPVLSSKLGGASTPSGAQATVGEVGAAGMSSAGQALNFAQGMQAIKQSKAVEEQALATAAKVKSETLDNAIHSARATAELHNVREDTDVKHAQGLTEEGKNTLVRSQIEMNRLQRQLAIETFSADVAQRKAESESAGLSLSRERAESKFYESDAGKKMPAIRGALEAISGVGSAAGAIRGGLGRRPRPSYDATGRPY